MLLAFFATLAAAPSCTPPALSLDQGDAAFTHQFAFGSPKLEQVKSNFAKAYEHACAKGLLKSNLPTIVLLNAPNANVASIYSDDRKRRVLEYPFVTEDGQAHIPPVEELEETIYCAVHGASAKEQEESGRCLPD
jgi:hypothetical protein